jgi:FecCD transport family
VRPRLQFVDDVRPRLQFVDEGRPRRQAGAHGVSTNLPSAPSTVPPARGLPAAALGDDPSPSGDAPGPHRVIVVLLVLAPLMAFYVSLFVGRFGVAPLTVLQILGSRLLPFAISVPADAATTVIMDVRLPRVLLAMLAGAGLAISGAAFQGMFRNPLVSPDILGVSAAAGFGAALAILLSANAALIQISAFGFGLLGWP